MTGLEMKYFVLKPKSKEPYDSYAHASREAMKTYAKCLKTINPQLSAELRGWIDTEGILASQLDEKFHE